MKFEPDHVYHIYNQGNNKQQIFNTHEDYKSFLSFFKSYALPNCDVLAWCLLPNHFHFMVLANDKCFNLEKQGGLLLDPLTNGFRKLLSGYSHEYNKRNQRTGSLFRPKTKAKDLSLLRAGKQLNLSDYYINCFHYTHQNPLRHQLVTDLNHWKYSSFRYYAGHRKNDFCNDDLAREICDYNPTTFAKTVLKRIPDQFVSLLESY
jgi:REP element-mobilizing transposase RayT